MFFFYYIRNKEEEKILPDKNCAQCCSVKNKVFLGPLCKTNLSQPKIWVTLFKIVFK